MHKTCGGHKRKTIIHNHKCMYICMYGWIDVWMCVCMCTCVTKKNLRNEFLFFSATQGWLHMKSTFNYHVGSLFMKKGFYYSQCAPVVMAGSNGGQKRNWGGSAFNHLWQGHQNPVLEGCNPAGKKMDFAQPSGIQMSNPLWHHLLVGAGLLLWLLL